MLYRAGHAVEITNGPDARIEIEQLSQADVQTANSAADGRRERAFDRDSKFLDRGERIAGQPVAELIKRFFSREHFVPDYFARTFRNFFNRSIENELRCLPDIATRSITFNKRNDRIVRNDQVLPTQGNLLPRCGDFNTIELHSSS